MDKETQSVLIITTEPEYFNIINEALPDTKYRAIRAISLTEARLKFSNEEFGLIVIDHECLGDKTKDFILNIRHKAGRANIKEAKPILMLGKDEEHYTKKFSHMDMIKFLKTPFSEVEFKKKLASFSERGDATFSNTITVEQDEFLINEGENSMEMYWVLSGTFIITKTNSDGHKIIIGEVNPGELVGEMSFLDNLPRSASVRAKVESEVLKIPHTKFIDVVDDQPRWFRSLMQTLSQRLRMANRVIARQVAVVDQSDEGVKKELKPDV